MTLHLPRHARSGSSAVEFALVAPFLMMLAMGLLDFGWFYVREAQVVGAATAAVRAGSILRPGEEDDVGCTPCLAVAEAHARETLSDVAVPTATLDISPRIEPLGGSCGVVLDLTVPHERLLGFLPVQVGHRVHVAANAPYVEACP